MQVADSAVSPGFEQFEQLSPKHQLVARCIAENPAFAAFATATDLASRAGVSTATVVRFAQALGFDGYGEFQQNARHSYLRTLQPLEVLQARSDNGRNVFAAQLYQDIENLRRTLQSLHTDDLANVASRIHAANEIVIVGSGSYAAIGLVLGHHLRFMGYRALVESRGGPHLTAALSPLTPNDLVIGISFWKGVRETIKAVSWAQGRGIPTVVLTDTVYAPIAKAADVAIAIPSEGVSFFQSMVAPLSVVYGLVAQLAHDADDARKQIMREAERSYDLLDIAYPS